MRRWAPALLLALCACAQPALLPRSPVAATPAVAIQAEAIPLDPAQPDGKTALGAFTYAGGLVLTSSETSRLHGLSDLKVTADGALLAVNDEADLLKARIVLDAQGRLVGVTDARLTGLAGAGGATLQGKQESDSEGVTLTPRGDLLVSFEEHDRILLYPADGSPARAAPSPDVKFPFNLGMEGLAAYPETGADAYLVGGEASGQTWICRLGGGCTDDRLVPKPPDYGLVAIAVVPGDRIAYLLRAWDPVRGNRVTLTIWSAGGEVARMDLARPLNIDNFEGLAAAPGRDGRIRFYLISDDNFSAQQRTLLMAFDWRP